MSLIPEELQNTLPIEIYKEIIDFLAADRYVDLHSLRACALVSHDFLLLARNHLYGVITLGFYSADLRTSYYAVQTFLQCISLNPEIAHHVHTLYYFVEETHFAIEGLTDALKMLTRLNTLTLDMNNLVWTEMPLTIREAVMHLLNQPTHLELAFIVDFIPSDLTLCANLKDLSISGLDCGPIQDSARANTLQLEKYAAFINNVDVANELFSARYADGTPLMNARTIQCVDLWFNEQPEGKAKELFKQCTQLAEIRIHFWKDFWESPQTIIMQMKGFSEMALPSLQTLRRLYFSFIINEKYEDPLCGLAAELEAIPEGNIIESIVIEVEVQADRDCKQGDEWATLNQTFTRHRSGWKNLKVVSLKINVTSEGRRRGGELEALVGALRNLPQNELKGLKNSKDFKFEFDVKRSWVGAHVVSEKFVPMFLRRV